jgi:hypothetical protein
MDTSWSPCCRRPFRKLRDAGNRIYDHGVARKYQAAHILVLRHFFCESIRHCYLYRLSITDHIDRFGFLENDLSFQRRKILHFLAIKSNNDIAVAEPMVLASESAYTPYFRFFTGRFSSSHTQVMPMKMMMASNMFTITPPTMMISRCQAGLALNSYGCGGSFICSLSMLSSIMPAIFTKPPKGTQPIPYSVSPIFFFQRLNQGLKNR